MLKHLIAATAVAGALLTPLAATATAAPGTGHSGRGQEHADSDASKGPEFPNAALTAQANNWLYAVGVRRPGYPWEHPRR